MKLSELNFESQELDLFLQIFFTENLGAPEKKEFLALLLMNTAFREAFCDWIKSSRRLREQ